MIACISKTIRTSICTYNAVGIYFSNIIITQFWKINVACKINCNITRIIQFNICGGTSITAFTRRFGACNCTDNTICVNFANTAIRLIGIIHITPFIKTYSYWRSQFSIGCRSAISCNALLCQYPQH